MKMNTAQRAVFCLREHDDHLLSQCHFSVEKPPLIYKLSRLRDHFGCTVSCEPGVAQIFIPAGAPLRLGADRAPHQPWPAIAARAHTSPRATHPTDPPRATMSLADNATWNAVKPFLNGGLSGMGATCIIQPLDIVKVRPSAIPPRRLAAPIRSRGVRRLGRARGLGPARPAGARPGRSPRDRIGAAKRRRAPPAPGNVVPPIPPNRQPTNPRPPHLSSHRFRNPRPPPPPSPRRSASSSAPPAAPSRSPAASSRTRASARSTRCARARATTRRHTHPPRAAGRSGPPRSQRSVGRSDARVISPKFSATHVPSERFVFHFPSSHPLIKPLPPSSPPLRKSHRASPLASSARRRTRPRAWASTRRSSITSRSRTRARPFRWRRRRARASRRAASARCSAPPRTSP